MSKFNRRSFMKRSFLATAGTVTMPLFLKAFDQQYVQKSTKKLVVIQWSGGNDGLNTIIPYTNDIYYKARPQLAIDANKVLALNDSLGVNPKLSYFRELFDKGDLSIINNVGYPNPDRSHFRATDIWHTASGSSDYLSTGWLGRYLDHHPDFDKLSAHHIIEVDDSLSLALKGKRKCALAMRSSQELKKLTKGDLIKSIGSFHHDHAHDENLTYLYQTLGAVISSADYLHQKKKLYRSVQDYPLKNKLAKDLKQVAELIIGGSDTQVYYLNMGGFDTHNNQRLRQDKLLLQYNDAIKAFIQDLKQQGHWKDTMIMTFSEFGRRVQQNGSKGTDHGKANNLFLMSGNLKNAGFYNTGPNLQELDKGDLRYEVDFRSVYSTILKRWLNADSSTVLGKGFRTLDLI